MADDRPVPEDQKKPLSRAEQVYRFFHGEPNPFKSYQELIPSQQPLGGQPTRSGFEVSAGMYGPPPGWSYQTSERGWKGEPLPPGAYGWTPQGEPYFQNGLIGNPLVGPIVGDFSQWAQGLPARLAPAFARDAEGEYIMSAGAGLGRVLGQTLSGIGEGLAMLFSKPVKSYLGMAEGAQQAGEGSDLPDVEEMLRRRLPAGWFTEYALNMNPLLIAYNVARAFTSPIPHSDKTKIFEANLQASRIAYSAWVDPALRQNYIQRYREGADPYLLAREMMNPWAEMWGELVLDPTNAVFGAAILGRFARGSRAIKAAEVAMGASDEVADALRVLKTANSDAQTLERVGNLARASMNSMFDTGRGIQKARDARGLWSYTVEAARTMFAEEASDFGRMIHAFMRDNPEDGVELLSLLARRASAEIGEVTEAVSRLARHPLGELLFNDSANRLGMFLRDTMTVDGVFKPGNFLDELAKLGDDPAKVLAFFEKKLNAITARLMPTIAERIKAGEQLPGHVVTLSRLAARVNNPVGIVNRILAGVYMGLSPGYAIRNGLTNYLHMFVDYGPEVFARGPAANMAMTEKLLGITPGRMLRDFGQYASARGVTRTRLPFARFAAWFEKTAGQMVYGHAVRKTMRSLLVPGKGLPEVQSLLRAGMSPDAVAHLLNIVWEEGGNVSRVREVFRAAHSAGTIETFRRLEFLEADTLRFLHDYNVNGVALFDLITDAIRPAATVEDGLMEVARIFDAFDEEAAHVFREAPMYDIANLERWRPATAQVIATAKKLGIGEAEAGALLAQRARAGERAAEEFARAMQSEIPRMTPYLTAGKVDVTLAGQLQSEASRLLQKFVRQASEARRVVASARDTAWSFKSGSPEAVEAWGRFENTVSATYRTLANDGFTDLTNYVRQMGRALPNYDLTPLQRALDSLGEARMWHEATVEAGEFVVKRGEEILRLAPIYDGDVAPTLSRFMHETSAARNVVRQTVANGLQSNWGSRRPFAVAEDALEAWLQQSKGTIARSRAVAMSVGDAARDFTLLNYGAKRGVYTVMGYLYPYQYLYGRTYANWMRRVVENPAIISNYYKYRRALEVAHAGAPEWYKYQINTNELLGLDSENPLWFNLEATLNPLNGLTGVDFNTSDKRKGWFASMLDDLGKFGPSTWTPFNYAVAVDMWSRGEQEAAAKWAGRLIPQTASIKSAPGMGRGPG